MKLRIVYDNEALPGFKSGWGFSCMVGDHLLFDTGADAGTLLFNMRRLSVNLEEIRGVVLSHSHGDHTGGLRILEKLGDVEVFVPASFPSRFKEWLSSHPNVSLVEVCGAREISRNVFTTGELGHIVREQALIVRTGRGLTVVTGCAHPGLENILREASRLGKVYGVVGGFHGFDKLES